MGQDAGTGVITPPRESQVLNGNEYTPEQVAGVVTMLDQLRAVSTVDYVLLAGVCHYRHLRLPPDTQALLLEVGLILTEDGKVVIPQEVHDVVLTVSEPDKLNLYDPTRL